MRHTINEDKFTSIRFRKAITVLSLCFIPLFVSTSLFYIDSYSLVVWEQETSTGPASIVLRGLEAYQFSNAIQSLPGVTRVSHLLNSWASVISLPNNTIPSISNTLSACAPNDIDELPNINLTAAAIADDFAAEFPTIFLLSEGHYPANRSEIALLSSVANQLGIWNGDTLRYANTTGVPGPEGSIFRYEVMLRVVGIYTYAEQLLDDPLPYTRGDVIVSADLLGEISRDCWVYVGFDRSLIGPYDPMTSLGTLASLDESIKELDPLYNNGGYETSFYLQNLLIGGIQEYIDWHNTNRLSIMIDSIGIIFVGSLISFLNVRFYYQRRKKEALLLYERGSSRNQVLGFLAKEMISHTAVAYVIGLLLGILLAQLGLHFLIHSSISSLPLMIRFDTLILIATVTFILPLLFLFSIRQEVLSTEQTEQVRGKLRKISHFLNYLKLDSAAIILWIIIIILAVQLSLTLTLTIVDDLLLIIAPCMLLITMSNLVAKGGKRLGQILSTLMERISGRYAARVGIRSLGCKEMNVIPLLMLIALISSMLFSSLTIDANIPQSYLDQTRFAIGGDATLKLDNLKSDLWSSFIENVSETFQSSTMTMVFQHSMFLSTGLEGAVNFYAMNPLEYSRVGYDHHGHTLDASALNEFLKVLSANASGAIVTQDVADEFQLTLGDSMRGFRSNGTGFDVRLFTVIGIVPYLPDFLVLGSGYISPTSAIYPDAVGSNKVWVNSDYMSEFIPPRESTATYLCMRSTDTNGLSERIAEIRLHDTQNVIDQNGVAIAIEEANELLGSDSFAFSSVFKLLHMITLTATLPVIALMLVESSYYHGRYDRHILQAFGYGAEEVGRIDVAQSLGFFVLATAFTLAFSIALSYANLGRYVLEYGHYVLHYPEIIIVSNYLQAMLAIAGILLLLSLFYLLVIRITHHHFSRGANELASYTQNRTREIESRCF